MKMSSGQDETSQSGFLDHHEEEKIPVKLFTPSS